MIPILVFAWLQLIPCLAAEAIPENAFPASSSFPWYDARNDRFRPVNLTPPDQLDERGSRWSRGSGKALNPTGWSFSLRTVLEVLAWIGVVGLVGLVAFLLVRVFLSDRLGSEGASGRGRAARFLAAGDELRVENLPFHVGSPNASLLDAARYWYERGDYSKAIVYLYGHLLVELDRHHCVRLARGKTNRQYLRELRDRAALLAILKNTMFVFEDAFFGEQPIAQERFEACWRALPEFERLLEPTPT